MHRFARAYETRTFRAVAGVYRKSTLAACRGSRDFVAETGVNRPLLDVNGKHFWGSAPSGPR